ncbi:MAG: glycosyltransferase [bacterium]
MDGDHGIPSNLYNKHAWILGNPEIGEGVWIGAFCLVDAANATLKIGRGTEISSGAKILTHSTIVRAISERRYGEVDSAPVEIGEFCFVGTNSTVLMGARIGHHSVIGAGSVVTQFMVIPPYSIVVGIPAKVVGSSKKFLKGIEPESLSVVIPAYNEVETIEGVVKDALKVLKKIRINYEIVLVDDGSTDGTGKIIDRLAEKNRFIHAQHHKINKGFTGAMKTCFESARKDLIFLAPGDGGFGFEDLSIFLKAIRGCDAVTAYISRNEESFITRLKVLFFHVPYTFLCRYLFGIKLREFSSVSMWRRRVLKSVGKIESEDRSAMFLPELVSKALKKNFKFGEVKINWHKRKGGEAKGAKFSVAVRTFFAMLKLVVRNKQLNSSTR